MYQLIEFFTMTRFATAVLIIASTLALPASAAPPGASETGLWIDDTGKGAVEIAPCGKKLCGRIVWLQDTKDAKGRLLVDDLNTTPGQRGKPICGLQVLGALERQTDGSYDSGWVYDPKVGKSFDAAIGLKDANHLSVTGYQGIKLFGKTFVWTRAPRELARCAP
jgi:uncharacterized protein (DUF2147 family)